VRQTNKHPAPAAFHALFLEVSKYLAFGYLFYYLIDQAFPIRIGSSVIAINPVALVAPYLFSWFTSRLTSIVLGKSMQTRLFFGSLVNFFIIVFVNSCAVFGLIPLNQGAFAGDLRLEDAQGLEALKYVFGPMLLYGGVFANWVFGNFLLARREQILIGDRPAGLGWVLAVKFFSGIMFVASFFPVTWIGVGFVQRFIR
jgi:hypothetical protein